MRRLVLVASAFLLTTPAQAEVVSQADAGFVVRHVAEVTASAESAWAALIDPAAWWNAEHSFSGDARNLSIDARAGGCFCEVLPSEGSDSSSPRGGVEHMRVIFVERDKALRMAGALGPLQSEALLGTLTITLKPVDGGTRLTWEYVVAGFMRYKPEQIVPAVDKLIGEQSEQLAGQLGPKATSDAPEPEAGMETGR